MHKLRSFVIKKLQNLNDLDFSLSKFGPMIEIAENFSRGYNSSTVTDMFLLLDTNTKLCMDSTTVNMRQGLNIIQAGSTDLCNRGLNCYNLQLSTNSV